jgi:type IV pilus assembly protein PilC
VPTFVYKGVRQNGEKFEAEVEAPDRFAVYNIVRRDGATLVSVKEKARRLNFSDILGRFGSIKEHEKIVFTRNLAAMINAGLSLSRALSVVERQSKNPKLLTIVKALGEDIQRGGELNAALAKFPNIFSPLMISMVKAGEESGTLAESLRIVSAQMEQSYLLKKKIRGAMLYPAIIIAALIVVGILMLVYIVPTLSATFEELGADLPASTRAIIALSDFLGNNTVLALGLFASLGAGMYAGMRTRQGKRSGHWLILHIPLINGIAKETNAARTGRTLSSLLSSGVNIVSALDITHEVVQNSFYKEVLAEAKLKVQKGEPLSGTFSAHEKLYPPLMGELVAVGEETGKLPDMLLEAAMYYEGEVEQKTKNISTIIEPFLMIAVGVAVGFFAISMISPIYSVTSSI